MKLEKDTTISHYKILSEIGKGGMGEVYRALDERLGRNVAIKILPEDFAQDKDRLARFEQEAKATSALNHPNILTVFDIGEYDDSPFIVSELLDGEELRGRLEGGKIPEKKTLDYARQIASGLSAAHGKGIVHRDLKPENIFITPDERVKILDFGIAKLTENEPVETGSEDATRKALTNPGMVLGTAAYMSPEQVRGAQVDHRSDVFSFGIILHEMLTGKRAFHRETMAETMAAILKEEPDELSETNPNINPAISGIVARCLEKKPEHRFQSTNDLVFALENLSANSGASRQYTQQEKASIGSGSGPKNIAGIAAAVVVTALLVGSGIWYFLGNPEDPHKGLVVSILPPEGQELSRLATLSSILSISPDGLSVLFRTSEGLYVRHLNSNEPVKIRGSEGVANQALWRDSSTITFHTVADGWISIRIPDGAPETVADWTDWTRGGSWNSSGKLLFSSSDKLWAAGDGSRPLEVKNPNGRKGMLMYPDFIGDSEDFLVLFIPEDHSGGEIWMATLSGNEMTGITVLFSSETQANYTPYGGGRVLFVRNDNLYSQGIDLSSRSMQGEPELIVQKVASQIAGDNSRADFSVSDNGVVAWRSGQTASAEITAFSRSGEVLSKAGPVGSYADIDLSPVDGSRLLVDRENAAHGLVEIGQGGISDLPDGSYWFDWTGDGKSVVGIREGKLIAREVNGGEERVVGTVPPNVRSWFAKALSPDGTLLLHFCEGFGPMCVSRLGEDGAFGNPQPLVNADEFHPVSSFSPDGKYILYRVSGSGASRGIYVQRFPGSGRRTLLTQDADAPVWRGDGKEIVYSQDGTVWAVDVSGSGDDLSFGKPQELFSGLRYPANIIQQSVYLQVSVDGSKFYWVQAAEQPDDGVINIKFGF